MIKLLLICCYTLTLLSLSATVDNANPVVTCAAPISQNVNCGVSSATINFPVTSATDDCGVVSTSYSSSGATTFASQLGSSATMNVGTSTVTATVTDGSGKTSSCTTAVTITQSELRDYSRD